MVNLQACLINVGASVVPLLVMAALNGAQPAHAAESNATGRPQDRRGQHARLP